MADQGEEVAAAASKLTHTMAQLVRAIDAVGDDGEAGRHLSEGLAQALEDLSTRVSAAIGFTT